MKTCRTKPTSLAQTRSLPMLLEVLAYVNLSWLIVRDYLDRLTTFIGFDQDSWFSLGFVESIARGEGIDPYRGRLLVPLAVVTIGKIDDATLDVLTLAQIQALCYLVCTIGLALSVRIMLSAFGFNKSSAFGGSLLILGLLPIAMRDHGYQAWSWFEALTIPLAVTIALRRRTVLQFVLLVAFASLNRETGILLPLIPLAIAASGWQEESRCVLAKMAVLGGVIAVTIRVILMTIWPGPTDQRELSLDLIHEFNQGSDLWQLFLKLFMLLGVIVAASFVAVTFRLSPQPATWIAIFLVPPYFGVYLYFALWVEVRVLFPVVLVLLPVALGGFFEYELE